MSALVSAVDTAFVEAVSGFPGLSRSLGAEWIEFKPRTRGGCTFLDGFCLFPRKSLADLCSLFPILLVSSFVCEVDEVDEEDSFWSWTFEFIDVLCVPLGPVSVKTEGLLLADVLSTVSHEGVTVISTVI